VKLDLLEIGGDADWRRVARCTVEHGGRPGRSVETALRAWLTDGTLDVSTLDAVGHRIVHGGAFDRPVFVDDKVVAAIASASVLAPLHNASALEAMEVSRRVLGPGVPTTASFDTAFHARMPAHAARYAIRGELVERYGLRRYGFHGLAHAWMAERATAVLGLAPDRARLVTFQLGAGCSAAAVLGGRSVDTSMGLTPLEGLVMATRSGDADPSLAAAIARATGTGVDEAESVLERESGLLGVSGRSGSVRDLLVAEADGDERAALALTMYCARATKYLGAYLAVLGGVDGVVFGGGVGEHEPAVRARVCAPMAWAGIELDPARNAPAVGFEAGIAADGRVPVLVVPVDEAVVIARDAVACIQ